MTTNADVDNFLAHHGVKGMKWGKRKAFSKGAYAGALGAGIYGRKSAYTDPQALATRKKAGKLRIAAMLTGVATNLTAAGLQKAAKGPGAQATATILNTIGGLTSASLGTASAITAVKGIHQERSARGLTDNK